MKVFLFVFLIFSTSAFSQIVIADDTDKILSETVHSDLAFKVQKVFDSEQYLENNKFTVEKYSEYYDNDQIRVQINFKDATLDGDVIEYWRDGSIKRNERYNNGRLLNGTCWDQNGELMECPEFKIQEGMQ